MRLFLASAAVAIVSTAQAANIAVDSNLPKYVKSSDAVAGTAKFVGSDTMVNLATFWGEGFKAVYPNVKVEIEGKGSATAPPALIEGTSTFGPMSRPMKPEEASKFESKFGYKPASFGIAIDTLAVFVHKDNPLKSLTLKQVDAIFSKTRNGKNDKEIKTWGDLGLTGEWKDKPISLYGRNSASGTYGYFKEHALFKGDFKDTVKEQPGTAGVVLGVTNDKYGIGYSGVGGLTSGVKPLPLAAEGDDPVEPKPEYAYDGTYPLSRALLIYVNLKPGTELDPLRREFIKYMLSKQGQEDVIKDGYLPVTAKMAEKSLKAVGLTPTK